jgi:hypothetical protein
MLISSTSRRVQLPQIRYPILLRHIWVLCILGISSIRHPSPYAPIRACRLARRRWRASLHHPRHSHARYGLRLQIALGDAILPQTCSEVPGRLRYADLFGCKLCYGVLGKIQRRESDYVASRRCIRGCGRTRVVGEILAPGRKMGWNRAAIWDYTVDSVLLRSQCLGMPIPSYLLICLSVANQVSHGSRRRISSEEASWVPLGLLLAGGHHFYRWSSWSASSKWADSSSANPHNFTPCDGSAS